MLTFKQLEAVFWIAHLGGFAAAAKQLNTTQSAISKRIQELEEHFDLPLFDRTRRSAKLTPKGEELLAMAKNLLDMRDDTIERMSRPEIVTRRVRIGVTELTALSWLPRFVYAIQMRYPKVVMEPSVDVSARLRERLLGGELDLAIAPDVFDDADLSSKPIAKVESAWMCKPGLIDTRRPVALQTLANYTLLTQGPQSGAGMAYNKWIKSHGLVASGGTASNLLALIGMTVSGLGVSYLPLRCLSTLVTQGLLDVVQTRPTLPELPYVALYRNDRSSALVTSIISIAQENCDFTRMFHTGQAKGQEKRAPDDPATAGAPGSPGRPAD